MAVAGIHFGNTNSVISICKDGRVETVANETGDRITPTIVAYTGSEKVVGQPARQYIIRNPHSCISHIKASIGQSFTDDHVKDLIQNGASCQISNDNGTISFKVKFEEDNVTVSAIDAASYIFTKLLEIAEQVGGSDLEDVVIAVPANFTEEQKLSLCEAAENIGCNILRVISEPASALLGYGIGQEDTTSVGNVLIYRLGGSSMDATIMNVNSGMYRFIGQKVQHHFGGKNFDDIVVQHFIQEFNRKHKVDISSNKRAIGKLYSAVQDCKHGLTRMQSTTCFVESLHDGIDFQAQLQRARFESLCVHLFSQCVKLVEDVLQSCCLLPHQIHKVVLVGGGAHMPRLVQLFQEQFQKSEILNTITPDELLAQGAAIQASILQGREDTSLVHTSSTTECLAKNIGIKLIDVDNKERLEVIIPKNTPVPVRREKKFQCAEEQCSVCVAIHESADESLENSTLLAKIVMKGLGNKEKCFTLNFEVKRNCHVLVTLMEKNSNRTEQITITCVPS